jgi:hypothetical protein
MLAAGCGRPPKEAAPIVRWDFVGSAALAQQTQAPTLKDALNLPEADAAGAGLATNVTRAIWMLLSGRTNAPADIIATTAPTIRELLQTGSSGAVWMEAGGKQYVIAGRMQASRAGALRDALARFLASAGVTNTSALTVTATNSWITIASSAQAEKRLKSGALEGGQLLKLEVDFPALGNAWPFTFLPPPHASLTSVATNKIVRTSARLQFPEAIAMDLEAWRPPLPMIYDPIVNFTAARGVKSLIEKCAWYRDLHAGAAPNQVFLWDQQLVALQKFFAAPMAEPEKFVDAVAAKIAPLYDTNAPGRRVLGDLNYSTNRHSILIQAMPGPLPMMGPLTTNDTKYLMGGLYMATPTSNAPPTALMRQLERPNLIAYDWEITAESSKHWRFIRQAEDIVFLRDVIPGNAAGQRWFLAATPKMGNTVTEVTRVSPTEWDVVRSSPAGLSGFELVQLVRWIDDGTRGTHSPRPQPGTRLVPAGPLPRTVKPRR